MRGRGGWRAWAIQKAQHDDRAQHHDSEDRFRDILGVINLRGAVMPVLDLRCRLGLGKTEPSSRHVIVVIQHGTRMAGVLVDGVQETFQLAASLLHAPPAMDSDANDQFVDAIIPLEGRMLSRLVVGSLLPLEQAQAAA